MKNKLYTILLITLILFTFSACGLNNVTEKQLKEDIIAQDEIQNCYASLFVTDAKYKIKDFSILKEQFNKENKEDIFFCEFLLDNEYVEVKIETEILYNYYDKGGWILENLSFNVLEINPTKSPDIDAIMNYIRENMFYGSSPSISCLYNGETYYVDDGDLTLINSTFDKQSNQINVYANYTSPTLTIDGSFVMLFTENEWTLPKNSINMEIDSFSHDYSKAIGEFQWDELKVFGVRSAGEITIHNITNDTIEYSIDFEKNLSPEWYNIKEGDHLTANFNPFTGLFTIGEEYFTIGTGPSAPKMSSDANIKYDPLNDQWILCWTTQEATRK